MNLDEMIKKIYEKDTVETYKIIQEIEALSEKNNEIYKYMDIFLDCINDENSCIRSRAIILISANAKWDKNNIINMNIEKILEHIEDEKPIVSRKYIQSLENIIKYKKELIPIIKEKLENVNYSKYKESMSSLIKRDTEKILEKCK